MVGRILLQHLTKLSDLPFRLATLQDTRDCGQPLDDLNTHLGCILPEQHYISSSYGVEELSSQTSEIMKECLRIWNWILGGGHHRVRCVLYEVFIEHQT